MLGHLLKMWPESLLSQALLVGLVVGVLVYRFSKKRFKMPPGPKGWPVIGNMLDLIGKEKFCHVTDRWSKEYGPVITIHLASMEIVVLSRIDVVLEALVKKQADFAGRGKFYANEVVFEHGSDILSATYGPRWKLHRKLASTAIRHFITGDIINKTISKTVKVSTKLMLEMKEPFDPFRYISLSVYNVIYGMCFNKFSKSVDDEMFDFYVSHLDKIFAAFGNGFFEEIIPPLRLCPTGKFKRLTSGFEEFLAAIEQEVSQHRKTYEKGVSRDFTDSLLLAQEEAASEEDPVLLSQITNKHLVFTLTNVFFAGIDTSRTTLHWALLVMALHPDIQKKVHQEVDAVIDSDFEISLSMRDQLPYTEAVLYETMRFRPVVPMGVPHETLMDTSVGGYELPKGTMVMINHHSLHFDPDQWENANEFRPERFLDSSGKMAPKPESWLPFSAGRRVCLGETLARPELHLILAGIMRACFVELAPGDKTDLEPLDNGVFFNAPKKYKIVVKPRI